MEPVVHFRAAVSLLGRFPALAGVDLDVQRGSIALVHGPNGAGKTTLLRTCAGLVPVVDGEAIVLGHDLRDSAERRAVRRRVGLLSHATCLYDDLTVTDNVRFWARACGATIDEADAAMTALGVDGRLADVTVAKLSAGQRRRTSIAAMVARRPELWLLDEPHAGLDAAARDVVDGLVRRPPPRAPRSSSHRTSSSAPARSRRTSCSSPEEPFVDRPREEVAAGVP